MRAFACAWNDEIVPGFVSFRLIVLSVINFNHFISKFFFIIPREEESFPSKKVRQELRECCSPLRSTNARESKTVLNSGFHAADSGFLELYSGF